jgi:hypothetical protein
MRIERAFALAVALAGSMLSSPRPGHAEEPRAPETAAAPASPPSSPGVVTPAAAVTPSPTRGPARWYETSPDDPRRFSIAGHLETQLIGLAFGLRAEALYRPFRPDRGANLRVGLGLQGGPEFFYLPIDVGWRQHFVPHRILALELGAGFEQQTFFVPELAPISRTAIYTEGGLAFQVMPGGWLGAQVVSSWAFGTPGPGLAVRLGFRWTLGGRRGGLG